MAKPIKDKVNIHYQKNPLYREIHVDGLFGGLTPKGKVSLNFYGERLAIPKCEEHAITKEGKLGRLTKVSEDSKDGIIREIEFGTYFDIEVIKDLKNFLETKIKEHETYFPSKK
jgi:hypothetical protein